MPQEFKEAKAIGSSTQVVLRYCLEIENTCSSIYSRYAEIFAADPLLQRLWYKIADEELNHAHIISMAMRCKGLQLRDKNYDMNKFRNSARNIKEILAGLQKVTPSPADALRSAINLEKRLAEFHLNYVADFVDPAEGNFFQTLFEGDKRHLQRLEEALQLLLAGQLRAGS